MLVANCVTTYVKDFIYDLLTGKQLLISLAHATVGVVVCWLKVAPPVVVGAKPMAVLIWQHVEFFYACVCNDVY